MAAPAPAPKHENVLGPSLSIRPLMPPSGRRADLVSPPLIAMVAVVGAAFLVVFYVRLLSHHLRLYRRRWRQWRRRRRLALSTDLESNEGGAGIGVGFDYYSSGASSNYFLSPYGLDDLAIKTLPLSFYTSKATKQFFYRECAVCLVEFEENDSIRTLPLCAHAFHVDCIDVWLRSHANCPLCRAAIFLQDSSPFVPMRAARIRPSLDDLLLEPPLPPPLPPPPPEPDYSVSEIIPEAVASPVLAQDGDPSDAGARDFLLKRSYSFGFERNLVGERMLLDSSTASPWRYRQNRGFWSKRWPSPFGGGGGGGSSSGRAARVFSFRSYRGVAAVKSPFFRRRSFFPLSESSTCLGAGPSSRRTRSLTSPVILFPRPPSAANGSASSRLRCGDPEALLSPERLLNPGDRR